MRDQYKIFIDEYMKDYNGSRAAKAAGYSSSSTAHELLRNNEVKAEIDRRISEMRAKDRVTVEKIEGMLRDMAEVEPLDIWDEDGNVRPLRDIPPHARRAIKSIKRVTKEHYITGQAEETVHVELWDKKGAVELLGKAKKMFTDRIEADVSQKVSFSINGISK
jgi:phage terminase small subunit